MPTLDNLEIKATGNVDDAIKKIDQLLEKLGQISNVSTQAAGGQKDLAKETSSAGKSMQAATKSAAKASSSIGNLFNSLKRIAMYRLLRSVIKAVTSAFSEGTKNVYAWADANGHAFKQVMDTYATRTNYLKNNLGAVASTVLTALLPAFLKVTDALITAINFVNEFIAAIAGKDTYLRAREVAIEFGDAADDAAKKQKRLNIQLMAFDELNNITTPSSSGATNTDNIKDAFEEVVVGDWMKKHAWFVLLAGIGTAIAAKVGSGLLQGLTGSVAQGAIASLGNSVHNALSIAAGVTLMIIGIKTAWDGGAKMAVGNLSGLVEALGGTLATALGGTLIGSSFGAGGLGFVIGAELGVAVTIAGFVFGSDAGKRMLSDFGTSISNGITGKQETKTEKFIRQNNFIQWFGDLMGRTADAVGLGGVYRSGGSKNGNTTTTTNKNRAVRLIGEDFDNGFASGGFPGMGSIFMAGEVPGQAELLGTVNGRTAVAGGNEITGIAEAVYTTGNEEASILREIRDALRSGGNAKPNAAFGRFATRSIEMYKGVTG